ncbi:FAD-dependent monooxygenase [Kaistia nematophila]|uniref:FAD-dependent monooxygenase n=1 Tax=Kaistia nematophila TaxID=2994654 RepID=A0A9X3DZY7_9HYPH|nr:FAD-dependent monooxygenase [Kaistia nematophila]MCX5569094.1 FAD-dependent monooxygenase [Kaistia nematophila]
MEDLRAEILVVGAGPVGLTLAAELARHGVRARIVDRSSAPLPYCRAIGVTPRSLEVFEDMGIARDLIDAGLWLTGLRLAIAGSPTRDVLHDFSDLPYSSLGVPQYATEAVLTAHLATFGVVVEHGTALTSLDFTGNGIEVGLDTPQGATRGRYRYVIGCDGAHSAVRKALGIGFDGDAFPMGFMLGDVHIDWDLPRGLAMRAMRLVENGPPDFFIAIPLPGKGRYRVSMMAPEAGPADAADGVEHGIQTDRPGATLADLQAVADRLLPEPAVLSDMRWSSTFRISMRLADRYRVGDAFIAGDAGHIHPPTGGQGMNTGIQDAYNLAWKLALVAEGKASAGLLDSYEGERLPVAADVVARTTEQSVNFGRDRAPPNRLQDTQLLVAYRDGPLSVSAGEGPVQAGDRVPDAQGLRRAGFGYPLRLFDLLRGPRFVLLVAAGEGDLDKAEAAAAAFEAAWPGLVRVVAVTAAPSDAQPLGVEWVHDADGTFSAAFGPQTDVAWLVRPDKYVGYHASDWSVAAVLDYLRETIGLT